MTKRVSSKLIQRKYGQYGSMVLPQIQSSNVRQAGGEPKANLWTP